MQDKVLPPETGGDTGQVRTQTIVRAGETLQRPARLVLIGCAVLHRECHYCAAVSRNIVEVRLCEKALHDIGAGRMSARLQAEIDAVDTGAYDAILLAYGLCNNGMVGLHAKVPIVAPRAHDCITLLMGSKEKYLEYFNRNPGTYYHSSGWVERSTSSFDNPDSTTTRMGISTYQEYVDKYGEENAKYLMETLGMMANYDKFAYIDTGVGNFPAYKAEVRQAAAKNGWKFEEIPGSVDLLLRLVNGEWADDDFLVIPPGDTIEPTHDKKIIRLACSGAERRIKTPPVP